MSTRAAQVLVVDDQWAIRQQLSRALDSVGIACDCASDGDDALDRCLHCRYDLIVTDLRMPGRNGHSLAVALLGQPEPPMIVALTGVTEPRLTKDLLARGVADVVLKPVDFFELADRLKCMLESPATGCDRAAKQIVAKPAPSSNNLSLFDDNAASCSRRQLEELFADSPPIHCWLTTALEWIDWERLPNPPLAIRSTFRNLSRCPSYAQMDYRREARVTLNETAVALVLNDDFEPTRKPFKLIIRDISRHGIGLLHTDWLASQRLAVTWRGLSQSCIVVVAQVLRCRQVGKCFEIGAIIDHSLHAGHGLTT